MAFMIRILPEDKEDPSSIEPDVRFGEIILGRYVERFESSISYWKVEDYHAHWKKAIERIISGEEKSCLITCMYNPESANFIFWWPIYRDGVRVIIQNQILFLEEEKISFDPMNPFESVKDRQLLNEEGLPISVWEVHLSELEAYLRDVRT